jgi:biopolymer transport protein ExbD
MAFADRSVADAPLGEINTTPLIDVLLVLLVVLVMAVPAGTDSLEFNLPTGEPPIEPRPDPIRNRLSVTQDGAILWNEDAVSRGELTRLLGQVRAMAPEPQVEFEPEPQASYALSADVLRQVKAAELSNFGITGTQRHRAFDRVR